MENATDTYWSNYRAGERFGRLTILGFAYRRKRCTYVRCKCDCGNECVVRLPNLVSGKTHSCGCLRHDTPKRHYGGIPKIVLSEETKAWILDNFPETKNKDIAAHCGISESTLHRFSRRHGLKKSEAFKQRCLEESLPTMKRANQKRKYPPKGYMVPRGDIFGFKTGVSNIERFGEEKEAARKRKCREARNKTIKLEMARIHFGIPQKTKLKLNGPPTWVNDMRYRLRRRGYIIPNDEIFNAYYTAETKRSARMEARKSPFRYFPMKEVISDSVL